MAWETIKIGTVDLDDGRGNRTPFGRVNITKPDGKKGWYFFKSRREWNKFFDLWHKLEKPWKLQYNQKGGWREVST